MNNPQFHPMTKKAVDSFITKPSHALVIVGQAGSGKKTVAEYISKKLINTNSDAYKSGQVKVIQSASGTIKIDQVRGAQDFIKLKTIGKENIKRSVIIENAERMSQEAQNALLKILEEPPKDTIILLTCANTAKLLPTILSRTQKLSVQIISQNDVINYFKKLGYNDKYIERAYIISEGRIGLINSILDGKYEELTIQIELAKSVLVMSQFEKLMQVDQLVKDKNKLEVFLNALEVTCSSGLKQAINNKTEKQINRWYNCLKVVSETQDKFVKQSNTKLLMTNLMLNL